MFKLLITAFLFLQFSCSSVFAISCYEYHGTCMHDESFENPERYFGKAFELHTALNLPEKELKYNTESIQWFVENNLLK